jgi:hypothetical protein
MEPRQKRSPEAVMCPYREEASHRTKLQRSDMAIAHRAL